MVVAEEQLQEAGIVSEKEVEEWKAQAAEEVQAAVAVAQQEQAPNPYEDDWKTLSSEGLADLH